MTPVDLDPRTTNMDTSTNMDQWTTNMNTSPPQGAQGVQAPSGRNFNSGWPTGGEAIDMGAPMGQHGEFAPTGNSLQTGGAAPTGNACLLYTSPSPRDRQKSRMPSSA